VFRAGVGGERGSYLLAFRSDLDAAGSSCSGRTWTLLALPVRGERKEGEGKAGWPGFPHSGKERARKKGESGKAGVPSQWEGTGQEDKEKSGKPGFPRNGRERTREKAGRPGFPRSGRERARKKWRKRESRGSLAMGGNGPGRKGESGKAGVPSQWKGTGQEEREKAGKPGFPRSGRERARKKGEGGLSARSEAESESVLELG
jgi:hypothetical protein